MNRRRFLSSLAIGLATLQLRLRPEPVPAVILLQKDLDELVAFLHVAQSWDDPRFTWYEKKTEKRPWTP